ncbi:uncharacterized protein AB675_10562 [Cyphellophora attinorum]|uniref:SnoaL-like domain-containing protein n=1 Tax=Cyphellophora attinorum TaxID=1664694 RepID=A0A0N0NN40_9EURO|nr:uncharacterized protein AB675_10562 [Phialophora attinorum]KPI40939.1 hypothetical protein AB675_10562 [Phialophora attinorum]
MTLSAGRVRDIFENLASTETSSKFWARVADDVHWTIVGSTPMSGVDFLDATIQVLGNSVLTEPLKIETLHVTVGAVEDKPGMTRAAVEMKSINAKARSGKPYDMTYCWIATFDDKTELIREVRAYIDTELLIRTIKETTG